MTLLDVIEAIVRLHYPQDPRSQTHFINSSTMQQIEIQIIQYSEV